MSGDPSMIELLREARAHVAATRDRTNTHTTYEAAVDLLARIDRALGDLAQVPTESDDGFGPDMDEERVIWP